MAGFGVGKVYMTPPGGGRSEWVDASDVLHYKKLGAKIANVRLRTPGGQERDVNGVSAGRLIASGASIVEPGDEQQGAGVAGALGRSLQTAAATIPPNAANMAPMLVPGSGWGPALGRTAAAFGSGMAADAASKGVMGEPQDVGESAMMGGINAAIQVPIEGLGALPGALKEPLMKAAFGNAKPDVPELALKRKQQVTTAGLRSRAARVRAEVGAGNKLVEDSKATFSYKPLAAVLRSRIGSAARGDVLGNESEKKLHEGLWWLMRKIGDPSGGAGRPLVAKEIDEIRLWADNIAKGLREGRAKEGVSTASPVEETYKALSDRATQMLRSKIPGLREARQAASESIELRRATHRALTRSQGRPTTVLGALMHIGSSPRALSRTALRLNDPMLPDAIRTVPRLLGQGAAYGLNELDK